jgi:hypothetical protein
MECRVVVVWRERAWGGDGLASGSMGWWCCGVVVVGERMCRGVCSVDVEKM